MRTTTLVRGMKIGLLFIAGILFSTNNVSANGLTIGTPVVTQNATTGGTVQFTISWNNAWNIATAGSPNNWDAVWITVWFKPCSAGSSTPYTHGTLNPLLSSHTIPASLQAMASVNANGTANSYAGFITESVPMSTLGTNLDFNDGIMLSPTASGVGNVSTCTVTLNVNNLPSNATSITTEVFGLEMVYVPEGSTTSLMVGDGNGASANASPYSFVNSATYSATPTAMQLGTANETGATTFYMTNVPAAGSVQQVNSVPAAFPKGVYGFYTMKYEITEDAYAAFLNMLGSVQQALRAPGNVGTNRNQLQPGTAPFTTTASSRAQNFLSWGDVAAFLQWDCLRPVTELEWEKACRGPGTVTVPAAYAWGSIVISQATTFNAPAVENGTETFSSGTAVYGNTAFTNGSGGTGPARVGIFCTSTSTQATAGCTYFGIPDMSGNVAEWVVAVSSTIATPGSGAGNIFTRQWGNGSLTAGGDASMSTWPAPGTTIVANIPNGLANLVGIKGGAWINAAQQLQISDRTWMLNFNNYASCDVAGARYSGAGGRGGR